MKTLDDRVRLIEDRFAILDVEAIYAEAWDLGRPEEWAGAFAVDGIFEMLPVGQMPGVKVQGSAALTAFCSSIRNEWSGLHFMHPPRLTIQEDIAKSLIFFEFRHVMKAHSGTTRQGVTGGYYRTSYTRTDQGWRIQERVERAVFDETAVYYGQMPD